MNNDLFWQLINSWHTYAPTDQDNYLRKANDDISQLSAKDASIYNSTIHFYTKKAEESSKVFLLAKIIHGSVTNDSLFYFALWLVSRGKDIYFTALNNPDQIYTMMKEKEIPSENGQFYLPEFEMFMDIGLENHSNDIEDDLTANEEDEFLKTLESLFIKELVPNPYSLYDLARNIDTVFQKSVSYFSFQKEKLSTIFEVEKQEKRQQANENKRLLLEADLITRLKKDWKYIDLPQKTYPIPEFKGESMIVDMPPVNDQIIVCISKYSRDYSVRTTTRCFWYNYKTKEEQDIILNPHYTIPHVLLYIVENQEMILFWGIYESGQNKKQVICQYDFATNSFNYTDIPHLNLNGKHLFTEPKSGIIYNNKVYFTVTAELYTILEYDRQTHSADIYKENALSPMIYKDQMYWLKPTDNQYKTLTVQNLLTKEEKEIYSLVEDYTLDKNTVYIVKREQNNDTILKIENNKVTTFIDNLPTVRRFLIHDNYMYIISDTHSFLLNLKKHTISEVPFARSDSQYTLEKKKYIVYKEAYDTKILGNLYEVDLI